MGVNNMASIVEEIVDKMRGKSDAEIVRALEQLRAVYTPSAGHARGPAYDARRTPSAMSDDEQRGLVTECNRLIRKHGGRVND